MFYIVLAIQSCNVLNISRNLADLCSLQVLQAFFALAQRLRQHLFHNNNNGFSHMLYRTTTASSSMLLLLPLLQSISHYGPLSKDAQVTRGWQPQGMLG